MIGSYYGRLFFGNGGAEESLGDVVNSQIVTNVGALSLIESIIVAQSLIDAQTHTSSPIELDLDAESIISHLDGVDSNISFDYKGRISGFNEKGADLKSNIVMTTGVTSGIDITPSNIMSVINAGGDGRISAISSIFDTLSTIESLTPLSSPIDNDDTGILSILR